MKIHYLASDLIARCPYIIVQTPNLKLFWSCCANRCRTNFTSCHIHIFLTSYLLQKFPSQSNECSTLMHLFLPLQMCTILSQHNTFYSMRCRFMCLPSSSEPGRRKADAPSPAAKQARPRSETNYRATKEADKSKVVCVDTLCGSSMK